MKNKQVWMAVFALFFFGSVHAQSEALSSLDSLILKKRSFNKTQKKGFCIQLYNGNEKTAVAKMDKFHQDFPTLKVFRIYQVPEWKIRTESFKTRLQADRILNRIKKKYPGARVL
jgi:hypothetical protein